MKVLLSLLYETNPPLASASILKPGYRLRTNEHLVIAGPSATSTVFEPIVKVNSTLRLAVLTSLLSDDSLKSGVLIDSSGALMQFSAPAFNLAGNRFGRLGLSHRQKKGGVRDTCI